MEGFSLPSTVLTKGQFELFIPTLASVSEGPKEAAPTLSLSVFFSPFPRHIQNQSSMVLLFLGVA